ncbi:MAG: gliding motility-associated C-terminal domain-containing protein, partial [Cytophagaceae bacterium]
SAGTYNWYDVAAGGSSLETAATFTTPSIAATTSYYVASVESGCESARAEVVATVNTVPNAPSTTGNSRCGTGTVTLSASGSSGTYNWYDVAAGGSSLETAAIFTTPSISVTTSYYVASVENGCESTRAEVVATINAAPNAPAGTDGNRCGTGSVILSASGSSDGYSWYDAATGGNLLATGGTFTTPILSSTATYYVSSAEPGCESATRTAVTATINSIPATPSATASPVCNSGIVTLTASGSGDDFNWYDSDDNLLGTGVSFSENISSEKQYRVCAVQSSCLSEKNTVTATIDALSVAGSLSGSATVCRGDNSGQISVGSYVGSILAWEVSEDNFVTDKTVLSSTADIVDYSNNDKTYYYRVIVKSGSCASDTSSVVSVVVDSSPEADPGIISGEASVNPGVNSGIVRVDGYIGDIIRWEYSHDNFATIAGTLSITTNTADYSNLTQTRWYRAVVKSGVCAEKYSAAARILVNVSPILTADVIETGRNKPFEGNYSVLSNDAVSSEYQITVVSSQATVNGGTINIDAEGFISYIPPKDYSGPDEFTYSVCDKQTGTFCLTAIINIFVRDSLIIYTSLTPNNDGFNDVWIIEGIEKYPNNKLKIINRWGDEVFRMNGYNNLDKVWKGDSNSGIVIGDRTLPDGTYFYHLELGDGTKPKSGFVVIKK